MSGLTATATPYRGWIAYECRDGAKTLGRVLSVERYRYAAVVAHPDSGPMVYAWSGERRVFGRLPDGLRLLAFVPVDR